jgi:transcriptional regulator with XRE-family HTH domain
MEILAKRLKWLREKERYSQKEIADKIGMSSGGYQKIEYGDRDPKLDVLVKLCDIYEVDADFLLGRHSTISELRKLNYQLNELEGRLLQLKLESSKLIDKISELRESLLESAKVHGFDGTETIYISKRLDRVISEHSNVLVKMDRTENEYHIKIHVYIATILNIPESKPWEDEIVQMNTPIIVNPHNINVDDNIYSLELFGKDGFIGTLDYFGNEEDMHKKMVEVSALLNGK